MAPDREERGWGVGAPSNLRLGLDLFLDKLKIIMYDLVIMKAQIGVMHMRIDFRMYSQTHSFTKTCLTLAWAMVFALNGTTLLADGVVCESRDLLSIFTIGTYSPQVFIEDQTMYTMAYSGEIRIYNIENIYAPQLVGVFSSETTGRFNEFVVQGNYLYIADTTNGILIVNIQDLSQPQLVSTYLNRSAYKTVVVNGNFMYTVARGSDLHVVDISDPTQPVFIAEVYCGSSERIAIQDEIVYASQSFGGVRILDVHDSQSPVYLGHTTGPHDVNNIKVLGDYVYLANGINGVTAYDVSDPTNPFIVGNLGNAGNENIGELGNVFHVDAVGSTVYASGYTYGFEILDFSDVSNPSLIVNHTMRSGAIGAFIKNGLAFVCDLDSTLSIFDITEPSRSPLLGQYRAGWTHGKVSVYEPTAYMANGRGGVKILDISDLSSPTEIGSFDTPGQAEQIVLDDNFAYVADGSSFLEIYNLSNLDSIESVSSFQLDGNCVRIQHLNNYVYIAAGFGGIHIVDVSDPYNPYWPSSFETDGAATDLHVIDGIAYLSAGNRGMEIIDVSYPQIPYRLSSIPIDGYCNSISVLDGYAFVLTRNNGLYIVDVQDTLSPVVVSHFFPVNRVSYDLEIREARAYIAQDFEGMAVLDISDPIYPYEIGRYNSPESARYVTVQNSVAYLSDYRGGVQILDITEGCGVCPSDFNGDGSLNFFDLTAYVQAFIAEDPTADFTGDGHWNFFDVSAFLQAYTTGCP
jgi:hypothetical protein